MQSSCSSASVLAHIDVIYPIEKMKKLIFICATATMISACGGGGGGGDSGGGAGAGAGTVPVAGSGSTGGSDAGVVAPGGTAPANKLAAYVGTYAAACNDHEKYNVSITSPSNNTLTIATRTDFYAGTNCTGAIIATANDGADVTASYVETVDTIVFTSTDTPVPAKVDKVTSSIPVHTRSVTGTAVTRLTTDGQPQWCIDFGAGAKTCILEGTFPAQTGAAGALFMQGSTLYELSLKGTVYVANKRYTKT